MTHSNASSSGMSLLEYLRTETQVDLDTFDIEAARELQGCIDCTSNQYEYYTELLKDNRRDVLKQAVELATNRCDQFPSITKEELAVEAAAVLMAVEIRSFVTGDIHVMANPYFSYSTGRIVAAGKRYHELFKIIDERFDTSRVVMKVPATWEGLQACRELQDQGIKTLATTLFTMEQVVLAGEARCVSISPFIHELKALFDKSYHDENPLLELCVRAQAWFERNHLPTRVKACANVGIDEILQLAGVAAFTVIPDDLRLLESSFQEGREVRHMSLFMSQSEEEYAEMEYPSYINEETKYRIDFSRAENGRAQLKLAQAIQIFCDFQTKAEAIVREAMEGKA